MREVLCERAGEWQRALERAGDNAHRLNHEPCLIEQMQTFADGRDHIVIAVDSASLPGRRWRVQINGDRYGVHYQCDCPAGEFGAGICWHAAAALQAADLFMLTQAPAAIRPG